MNNYGSRNTPPISVRPTGPGAQNNLGRRDDAYGYENPNMRQRDPMADISRLFGSQGGNGRPSWDWNNTGHGSGAYSQEFLDSLSGEFNDRETQSQEFIKRETLGIVTARFMAPFVTDVEMGNAAGRYAWYKDGEAQAELVPYTNGLRCPIRSMFLEFVRKERLLKSTVARNAAVIGGYNLACRMIDEQPLNHPKVRELFTIATVNALFMEMFNWMAMTPQGRQAYQKRTEEITRSLGKLEYYKTELGKCFIYMGLPNPYIEVTGIPTIEEPRQDASQYQFNNTGVGDRLFSETPNYGDRLGGAQETFADLIEDICHTGQQRERTRYYEQSKLVEPSVLDFGTTLHKRKDYENITRANRYEFDLEVFYPIGDSGWCTVSEPIWEAVSAVFERSDKQGREFGLWPHTVRIVKINPEFDDGWLTDLVRIPDEVMNMAPLTNPEILLPYLKVEDNGELSITMYDLDDVIKTEDETDNWVVTPIKVETNKPTVVVSDKIIESQNSGDIESSVDMLFDELCPKTSGFFSVACAARNWKPFYMDSKEEVNRVVQNLPMLIHGNTLTMKDFPSMINTIKAIFERRIDNKELADTVELHLRKTFNRWLVECRGYGALRKDGHYFRLNNMFEYFDEALEDFREYDRDTYAALHDPKRCARLFDRCKLFATPERRDQLLSTIANPLVKRNNPRTLIIERDMVITKVANMGSPKINDGEDTIIVKRSVLPEVFSLVERAYAKASVDLSEAPEFILSFDKDDTLWSFVTSDFDRNVATVRRIARRDQLVNLDFLPYTQ